MKRRGGVIALSAALMWAAADAAQQRRPTFREALKGVAALDNFHEQFLDSQIPAPRPGHRFVLVGLHINPSAGNLLVLSSDFKLVRELYGWELVTLPNESIVYHKSQVHFAPTHTLEIGVFDPVAMTDRQIYPPAMPDAVRKNFIARVSAAYQARGEDWFRVNNHPMDPERFDTALIDVIRVNEQAGSMTFPVAFGGHDPVSFSERVLVTCTPLAPAGRIQCQEAPAQ